MATRRELQDLTHLKLKEAEALLDAELYDGAVYLGGYVIEFALKARICRLLDLESYPEEQRLRAAFAVHDLEQLLQLSGLQSRLETGPSVKPNWDAVRIWNPEIRYKPRGTFPREQARTFLEAIRRPAGLGRASDALPGDGRCQPGSRGTMITRRELQELARLRLQEAEALLAAGLCEGAVYLGGYVIEFALKACICRLLDLETYPDQPRLRAAYTVHDLKQLLQLSGLHAKLERDPNIEPNWVELQRWSPEVRYAPHGTFSREGATRFLDAIRDPEHGVFAWMIRHW